MTRQERDLPVTSYALLGLLTFGDELTGYELKQRADLTLRYYWTSPAMSQVYSELARLAEHDLVAPIDGEQPTRYRITAAGRRRLRRWMRTTEAGFLTLKHPVALRLLMGGVLGEDADEAMTRLLEEYLDELARQSADLADVRASLDGADAPGQPFRNPALVAEWGLAYYESERRIAHQTLRRLREGS